MPKTHPKIDTKLIHAGEPQPRIQVSVSLPVFQTSTFLYASTPGADDVRYGRWNNTPNHIALHEKLAAIENAEDALVSASGMATISTTLLTLLSTGDHLLAQDKLYGGTHQFFTQDLPALGIEMDFISGVDPDSWEEQLRPSTKVIYVEAMTNPTLEVADLEAVVEFARAHNLISIIDNTFPSSFNFRPLDWGFDLSLHSATKYLNGHADIIAGVVMGQGELVEEIRQKLKILGGTLNPHACFLLYRGLKTLAVRMRHQNRSALQIAQFLEGHPHIARVNYPGLTNHPQHDRAGKLFDGFSGMLSFEVRGGIEAAEKFARKAQFPINAPSLGGCETLLTRPAQTSHVGVPPQKRRELGIPDNLIRLSVGIEDPQDLIDDFEQALG
ncbi:MAG: L-methionine gamma-lyase [Chloroflexi bacterium]|nr:L-methionine gamma-lyase [Chloroflexota bacterium]